MKRRFLSFCAAGAVAISFTACNDTGTTSGTSDTSSTTTTTSATTDATTPMTSATSENRYAAMADSVERNSQQGYYLNPRTGKAYNSLKVDRSTGRVMDDAGEPVWRYVDRRNWWVYGDNDMKDTMYSWNQVGEAQMEGDRLRYKGDGDKWVDYDTRWKTDDMEMDKKWKSEDGETKIKTDKDGDTKIKTGDEKIKIDKDGDVKIKNKDGKTKIDEDGTKKQKDN